METIELDTKKTRVCALQRKSISSIERKKMLENFWIFIDRVRQPTTNYKFSREESYV